MTPRLIVGLGNPGREYERTRHNLGWLAVDHYHAQSEAAAPFRTEGDVQVAELKLGPKRLLLLKPQTFMNQSGSAVSRFVRFYKIPLADVLVVHDEIDLPFGEVRQAFDRGPAGHQGVQSVMDALGTQAFHRLRIGIGSNRPSRLPAEEYVLQPFTPEETPQLPAVLTAVTAKIQSWVESNSQ